MVEMAEIPTIGRLDAMQHAGLHIGDNELIVETIKGDVT